MTPTVIFTVDRVDTRAACCVAGFWLIRQTAEPQKLTQTKWFSWVLVKIASINCFASRFFSRNTQRYPVKAFSHDMRCGAVPVIIIAVRCGGGANVCGAVRWRWKKNVAVRWKHKFLSSRTSLKEKRLKKWVWMCMCVCGGGWGRGKNCRTVCGKVLQKWWRRRGDGICRDGGMFGFNYFRFLTFYLLKNNKLQLLKIQRDQSTFYGTTLFRKVYCAYWK